MPHKKSDDGYLSVTEVLSLSIPKPFLNFWYGKWGIEHCERVKRESGEIGTQVHQIIEDYLAGKTVEPSGNTLRMFQNFKSKFLEAYSVKPVKLEQTHKCSKYKLQGTFDAIVDINGERYIADWKTSNSIDKISVPLQLCAYDYLQREAGLIGKGLVVRIDKEKDTVEIKTYPELEQYWPIFKACIKVARYVKWGIEDK